MTYNYYYSQEDYRGVASALTDLGATHTEVDIDRFGADLEAMARKISALQPEVVVGMDQYGEIICNNYYLL